MSSAATDIEPNAAPSAPPRRVPVASCLVNSTGIDPLHDPAWDRLAAAHPDFTFFHTAAWAKVLHHTYGHAPMYRRFYRGNQLAGILPLMEVRTLLKGRRGVSLPFTDACGPLAFSDSSTASSILDHLVELARERAWKYFEVRAESPRLPGASPSVSFHRHRLDLGRNPDAIFDSFDPSVRRAIRKAEQQSVTAEACTDLDSLLEFYRLHTLTRQRHGLPPQPVSFFKNIHEYAIKARLGFVVLARHQQRVIAGAVFFHAGKKAIYKFGASDSTQQELRGNNLAMWSAIQTLAERGCTSLDLGRTSLENEGLRRFKRSWGADEELANYVRFDVAAQNWVVSRDRSSGLHTRIFRNLPAALNRLAGRMLYPQLD